MALAIWNTSRRKAQKNGQYLVLVQSTVLLAKHALAQLKGLGATLPSIHVLHIAGDAAGCGVWICIRVLCAAVRRAILSFEARQYRVIGSIKRVLQI